MGEREIETDITIELSTSEVVRYSYKREEGVRSVERTVINPGQATANTSVADIFSDAERVKSVANHFDRLDKFRVS